MPGTPAVFNWLGGGRIAGVPDSVIATIGLYVIFGFVMSRMQFGRKVYVVGANEDAARASGFSTARTVILVYTASGFLAALAGWMLLGRLEASVPTLGVGMTLNVVAAAVIGGVSLKGGEGSIIGAFAGVLFLAMVNNALNLMNVDPLWVNAVRARLDHSGGAGYRRAKVPLSRSRRSIGKQNSGDRGPQSERDSYLITLLQIVTTVTYRP